MEVSDRSTSKKVIITEDDRGLNKLMCKNLVRDGWEVHSCLNGVDLVEQFESISDSLLLIDYKLPDMNAADAVRLLRERGSRPEFIVATGCGDESVAVEMMKIGARDYIVKDAGFLKRLPGVVQRVFDEVRLADELSNTRRELDQHRRRLALAVAASGAGFFECTAACNEVVLSDEGAILLGLPPGRGTFPLDEIWKMVYHEDRGILRQAFEDLQTESTNQVEVAFRTRGINIGERWILCRAAMPEPTEDAPPRAAGILMDITATKETEERTHRTNRILSAIGEINRRMAAETGQEELLQGCCDILVSKGGLAAVQIDLVENVVRDTYTVNRYSAGFNISEATADGVPVAVEIESALGSRVPGTLTNVRRSSTAQDAAGKPDSYVLFMLPLFDRATVFGSIVLALPETWACMEAETELMHGVASDIGLGLRLLDESRKRERHLNDLQRLTTAIEQSEDAILVTDAAGNIEYVNSGFEKLSGYGRQEIYGCNPRFLQSGNQSTEFYRNLWRTITNGKVWRGSLTNRRKNGNLYTVDASISPVTDSDGSIVSYVAVQKDITRALEVEIQLRQSQKLQAIGTLAGGIAHDFNNLLSAILGYSEFLGKAVRGNPEAQRDLSRVVDAGNRAKELVRQILTFSRVTEEERTPLRVDLIVKETLKLLNSTIPSTVSIIADIATLKKYVLAEPTQIHQIVMNLCTNAFQALSSGHGEIQVSFGFVELETRSFFTTGTLPAGAYVHLTVSDTGCGMDEATIQRIFEPFYSTKPPGQGTGLGLSTVHGITTSLKGAIAVHSELGSGSTFRVLLPCTDSYTAVAETQEQEAPFRCGGEKVFLVDDQEEIVELLQRRLAISGYETRTFTDSQGVLDTIREYPLACDLLITDMTMPRMTGLELCASIKAFRADLPVLILTGNATGVELPKDWTNVRVLSKPVRFNELLAAAQDALEPPEHPK